jgi:hypothetical protein
MSANSTLPLVVGLAGVLNKPDISTTASSSTAAPLRRRSIASRIDSLVAITSVMFYSLFDKRFFD